MSLFSRDKNNDISISPIAVRPFNAVLTLCAAPVDSCVRALITTNTLSRNCIWKRD